MSVCENKEDIDMNKVKIIFQNSDFIERDVNDVLMQLGDKVDIKDIKIATFTESNNRVRCAVMIIYNEKETVF